MADQNRGVVYRGPGKVQVEDIPFPKLELDYKGQHRDCQHGVILKVVRNWPTINSRFKYIQVQRGSSTWAGNRQRRFS